MQKEARKKDFPEPHGGRQKCMYVNVGLTLKHTLQHGPYLRIHPGMNIGLFIRKLACKATWCLLSKGSCFVRYPQIGGKSN